MEFGILIPDSQNVQLHARFQFISN